MSDTRSDGNVEQPPAIRTDCRAPEVVARLGGPVFVDMRPGCVRATCRGVTGVGPDRAAAFRALAARVETTDS